MGASCRRRYPHLGVFGVVHGGERRLGHEMGRFLWVSSQIFNNSRTLWGSPKGPLGVDVCPFRPKWVRFREVLR
jgi:hypothetical protein